MVTKTILKREGERREKILRYQERNIPFPLIPPPYIPFTIPNYPDHTIFPPFPPDDQISYSRPHYPTFAITYLLPKPIPTPT